MRPEQLRVTFLKSKNIQPVANFQQHGREEKDLSQNVLNFKKSIFVEKVLKGSQEGSSPWAAAGCGVTGAVGFQPLVLC